MTKRITKSNLVFLGTFFGQNLYSDADDVIIDKISKYLIEMVSIPYIKGLSWWRRLFNKF